MGRWGVCLGVGSFRHGDKRGGVGDDHGGVLGRLRDRYLGRWILNRGKEEKLQIRRIF